MTNEISKQKNSLQSVFPVASLVETGRAVVLGARESLRRGLLDSFRSQRDRLLPQRAAQSSQGRLIFEFLKK